MSPQLSGAIIGPLFREFNSWGLTNNYLALVLPNVTSTLVRKHAYGY